MKWVVVWATFTVRFDRDHRNERGNRYGMYSGLAEATARLVAADHRRERNDKEDRE